MVSVDTLEPDTMQHEQAPSAEVARKPRRKMAAAKTMANHQVVRTANGDYVLSRTLADPDIKPMVDAYMKQVTRTPETALQFLKDVGFLTKSGRLAKSYGG